MGDSGEMPGIGRGDEDRRRRFWRLLRSCSVAHLLMKRGNNSFRLQRSGWPSANLIPVKIATAGIGFKSQKQNKSSPAKIDFNAH